mmetsp:Transcript_33089/g.104096  ORF Transcript_33089/g.104096 Transcript_33089/m.104096 type:complete len:559 (-) Transcript_33089:450-2126(-)
MELSLLALSSPPPLAGKTVAVVGGGVGGLVAAGLLARQGAAVTVLEQRPVAGGRLGEHRLGPAGEWRFDSGPSLLLMPEVYRETFELLGDPEPLEMSPVAAPFYHAFFGDDPAGTAPIQLDPARRREEFAAAIERLEGWPGDSMERFDAYMAAATAALDGGWPLAIEERWDVKTVASVLPAFARSALRNFPANLPVGQSHMQQLRRYFPTSDKVRALLSFQDLYVGLSPYEAPAVFSLLQAMELDAASYGVRYPRGGFGRVRRRLLEQCEKVGVRVRTGVAVTRVEVSQEAGEAGESGAAATGVRIVDGDGSESSFAADIVLCNADLPAAEEALLPPHLSRADKLRSAASSSSVLSLSFALDAQFADALAHHTIVFAEDLGQAPWESLFGARRTSSFLPVAAAPPWAPGHFYVHCPTRTDPTAAPAGCDAITVLLPTPPLPVGASEAEAEALSDVWAAAGRASVVERLARLPGMAGWQQSIRHESVIPPARWRREYGLARGAVFGLASSLNQLSFLRPGPRHPRVRNLYFAGASARPGNGVPLVMCGARQVSELLLSG